MKHRIIFLITTIVCSICCSTAQNKQNSYSYVDLGLPSGTKLATCNVGASKPNDYGKYYTWRDATNINLGNKGRLPTMSEWKELHRNCIWNWVSRNGINGYRVRSKINGNSIFLPAGGLYAKGDLHFKNLEGLYWSSSICKRDVGLFVSNTRKEPGFMDCNVTHVHEDSCNPNYRLSVRLVFKNN